jgi:hypothetical protein
VKDMPDRNIRSYLNHHLASSVAALDTLEHLEAAEKGTPMARILTGLRADSAADRRILEELMARLKVSENEMEKATAWLGEKISRLRLPLSEQKGGPLHLLLTLEALELGLAGRGAMWLALSAAAREITELQGPNYEVLIGRAENQRLRVEKLRLEAARIALRPTP